MASRAHTGDQARARIRHRRRSGIGDERDLLPCLKHVDNPPGGLLFVVLVHRKHAATDAVSIEQTLTVTRVLGRDDVHRLEHGNRAQAHVTDISERCRHYI